MNRGRPEPAAWTRRDLGVAAAGALVARSMRSIEDMAMDETFYVRAEELRLLALHPPGRRALSFHNRFAGATPSKAAFETWRAACRRKLAELLGYRAPRPASARKLRSVVRDGVTIEAWVMRADNDVELPAYLLRPTSERSARSAVMAIHGHGEAEPCIGARDDYHHQFVLRIAQAGWLALCPEHRGFGALRDMANSSPDHWLDYWGSRRGHQFTLVTDGFLYGKTLLGQTVEDLVRWEDWLSNEQGVRDVHAVGISYGGDLAITYPPFSKRVRSIYCSGSMGSFSGVFARCYNAPAHCVPHVLQWMDRSDIAGLSAPVPIRVHFGERDTPGPENASAAYNETVQPSMRELRGVYGALKADDRVSMRVTPGSEHEFEIGDILAWLTERTT